MAIVYIPICTLELDLVSLAKGYALPHLPRMPELRGLDTSSFERHPSLPSEIRYKDKAREKQRKLKMKKGKRASTITTGISMYD